MKFLPLLAAAVICGPGNALAQSSAADQALLASLFNEPGRAQREFESTSKESPLLSAWAVATFAGDRCGLAKPSTALYEAAGGDAALGTDAGRRAFIVAGVVATMKYPTPDHQLRFCEAARVLLVESEKAATK